MLKEKLETKAAANAANQRNVHINSDGSVDNDTVNVSKGAGDEILWQSNGEAFTIYFPVSPFESDRFEVQRGQYRASGPIRPNAGVGYYPYYINIVGGPQGL